MTENELLDLLTDVRSDYIAQTEAFRQGKLQKKRSPRLLPIAAIFAVVLLAGAAIQAFLVPNWKQGTEEPEMQSFAATAAEAETAVEESTWQLEILNGTGSFYSQDYKKEMTFTSYTEEVQRQRETNRISPWRYAILDMDGNGTQELVIQYRMVDNGYFYGEEQTLVFWQADQQILERGYYTRQMSHIRADGAFYWSGSSSNSGWARLTGLDGVDPGEMNIPEDQWDQPEADWHSFDGGDAHSQAGPSADELLRLREREITYIDGEGNAAAMETELFIGRGYSIYIPKEGWTYTQETYGGLLADKWTYDWNPEINLRIVRVGGNYDRAEAWVRETESAWSFFWDEQGGLYGERDGKDMNVSFYPKEVDTIVALCAFPMEAYEGGGRTLSVLVDTFSRWPTEVDMKYPEE